MAKKKMEKTEATEKKAPAKKAAAAKSGPAKPAKAAAPTRSHAGGAGMPMIDTSLAAAAAARMLTFNKRGQDKGETKKEGGLVKQIKNELNKPHSAVVSDMLNESAPEGAKKPSATPFDQQRQVGHNQTFSPDVTRTGVPRRTSG